MKPYKFVKWDVPDLDFLKDSQIYHLWEKRNKLTRAEKDYLFRELNTNSYSRTGVPMSGWMFPFTEILRRFLVKIKYYGWSEVHAPDKTSIRDFYRSQIVEIISA